MKWEIKSNGKTEKIWITPRLKDVLASIQKEIAIKIKEEYKLEEITVYGTIASEILAARYLDEEFKLDFKIRKTSLNKGVLELE